MGSKHFQLFAISLFLLTSCTREVPRESGPGTQNTEAVQKDSLDDPGSVPTDVSDADTADTMAPESEVSPALPRDTKGVVGSPQASNIKEENLGQSPDLQNRQAEQQGTESGATRDQQNIEHEGTKGSNAPGAHLNVEQYSYAERADFKNFMQARLQSLDTAIEGLKATPELRVDEPAGKSEQATEKRAGEFDAVKDLEVQHDKVANRLKEIDRIQPQQWESFKTSFKNQVEELEKNYGEALQASRR